MEMQKRLAVLLFFKTLVHVHLHRSAHALYSGCEAGEFKVGTEGRVVCHFGQNVKTERRNFNVARYGLDSTSEDSFVRLCNWVKDKDSPECNGEKGYVIDFASLSENVTVIISEVSARDAGLYICQLVPGDGTIRQCNLTVLGAETHSTEITSKESIGVQVHSDEKCTSCPSCTIPWLIASLLFVIILMLVGWIAFKIIRQRRVGNTYKATRTCTLFRCRFFTITLQSHGNHNLKEGSPDEEKSLNQDENEHALQDLTTQKTRNGCPHREPEEGTARRPHGDQPATPTEHPSGRPIEDPLGRCAEDPLRRHTEDPLGRHTEDLLGRHTEDLLGRHTEDPLGRLTEDPLGRHTEDLLGKHTEDPLGRPTEDQLERLTEDQLGRHTEDLLGRRTEDPLGRRTEDPLGRRTEDPQRIPTANPPRRPTHRPPEIPSQIVQADSATHGKSLDEGNPIVNKKNQAGQTDSGDSLEKNVISRPSEHAAHPMLPTVKSTKRNNTSSLLQGNVPGAASLAAKDSSSASQYDTPLGNMKQQESAKAEQKVSAKTKKKK